jgi:hypothetical protein
MVPHSPQHFQAAKREKQVHPEKLPLPQRGRTLSSSGNLPVVGFNSEKGQLFQ